MLPGGIRILAGRRSGDPGNVLSARGQRLCRLAYYLHDGPRPDFAIDVEPSECNTQSNDRGCHDRWDDFDSDPVDS